MDEREVAFQNEELKVFRIALEQTSLRSTHVGNEVGAGVSVAWVWLVWPGSKSRIRCYMRTEFAGSSPPLGFLFLAQMHF